VKQAYNAAVAAADIDDTAGPARHPQLHPAATLQVADQAGGPQPPRSAPKPQLPYGLPITSYTHRELVRLVRWIESDTLLATDEELLDEVMNELGFNAVACGSAKRSRQRSPTCTAAESRRLRGCGWACPGRGG